MTIKVAVIGAGSIGFTRKLMHDILAVPELADTFFHFMDISQHNLEMITRLAKRDIRANNLPATITPTTNQREAVADSDYVISVIRQGGLDAFELDIDIPLKYGIDQCVGDTICAGGIMYGQRTIPALLEICRDIREVATGFTAKQGDTCATAPRVAYGLKQIFPSGLPKSRPRSPTISAARNMILTSSNRLKRVVSTAATLT